MEEKKLTDEEIINALDKTKQELANISPEDEDYDKLLTVKIIVDYCHDLIHRLQDEKQKVIQDYYCEAQHCDMQKDIIAKQKAEIERLTREKTESAKTAVEVLEQNIELQKQVDELTAFKNEAISMSLYGKGRKDGEAVAVKDTAKEILQMLYTAMPKTNIVVEIKKRYGVEVE